jgi:hypothetical protein
MDMPVDWDELEALVRDAWMTVATSAIRRRAGA